MNEESKSSISVSASLTEYGFARYPRRSVVVSPLLCPE